MLPIDYQEQQAWQTGKEEKRKVILFSNQTVEVCLDV